MRLQYRPVAPLPLERYRLVGDHADIPAQTAGVGHTVQRDAALVGLLSLALEVLAGALERCGVVHAAGHDAVFLDVFEHLEGRLQRYVGRQRADECQPILLRRPAPVIGPKHHIQLRAVLAQDALDHIQPLRIVAARPPARVRARIGLAISSRLIAQGAPGALVLAGELARFAYEDDPFCARAGAYQLAIGAFVVLFSIRLIRMLAALEVAVQVDIEAEMRGPIYQVV